jgi:lipoprotein-anchoring transpeptidase ErfK/SrfK
LGGFSATLRGDLYALELKASTAAARLVEFQVAVKGFGLQTLDLARLCHACTLPRWRRVRRRHARPVSVTPAAAHPYDQYIRGRSFFGALFGPSIARGVVSYPTNQKPGTIVVSTAQRRLYLVLGNGQALSYGIGVGKAGFAWSGVTQITDKREWPDWTPPDQMLRRRPDLPHHMAGGPDNPMGARGIYLGASLYRIHGSNEPDTIGQAVSSGCIRLTNEDVIDLYNRVHIGATVIVQ